MAQIQSHVTLVPRLEIKCQKWQKQLTDRRLVTHCLHTFRQTHFNPVRPVKERLQSNPTRYIFIFYIYITVAGLYAKENI